MDTCAYMFHLRNNTGTDIGYKSAWLQEAIHQYEKSDSFALDDPVLDWSIDWERVPPPPGVVLPNDEDDQVREEEQENGHGEDA